jgi:hypothetical protein
VYAAVIPDFPYQAAIHVNYEEMKLRIQDGLPKLKDLPNKMGGSGVSIPEYACQDCNRSGERTRTRSLFRALHLPPVFDMH